MTRHPVFLSIVSLFMAAAPLAGCETTPGLQYQVAEPAANSHAASLRRVAVMGFSGWQGREFARAFDASLREAYFEGQPWFDVTAPSGDPGLYSSGYAVSEFARAIEFGQAYGLDGVWFGDVDAASDASHVYYETRNKCVRWVGLFNCKKEVEYEYACREFDARASARLILMDVKAEQVVIDRVVEDDDSDTQCIELGRTDEPRHHHHARGYHHDRDIGEDMERHLLMSLAGRLRQEIAPYTRVAKAELMENPSLPYQDLIGGFAQAVSLAEDGRSYAACEIYESMSARYGPEDAALAYNLAACAEMSGDLQLAHERYQTALHIGGITLNEDFLSRADEALRRLGALQVSRDAMDYLVEDVEAPSTQKRLTPTDDADEDDLLGGVVN